jgi:hypothetical protein
VPDYGTIAGVSATLSKVLTDALQPLDPPNPPQAVLSDLQGEIQINPARITIFLFETVEDASARNRPAIVKNAPPKLQIQKPPMALLLRYMLTPWSGDRLTDHRLLGRAMQVLYDDAVLSGTQLQGPLAGTDQALKISLSPLTIEERARVWYAIQKPYRLSVTYEVRVVNLDAISTELLTPTTERDTRYLGPEAAQ